jgi:hypothetical protein
MPQQQPRRQPKKPKKPRPSKPVDRDNAADTRFTQQPPSIHQAQSTASTPLLAQPILDSRPETDSPKLTTTSDKEETISTHQESKFTDEMSRQANTTPRSDFSKQCHFTRVGFACTHSDWQRDPKITHVAPCKLDNHTTRCANMAKTWKQGWSDDVCPTCKKTNISQQTHSELERREEIMRRISGLDNVRPTQDLRAPTSPILAGVGFQHSLASLSNNKTQGRATEPDVTDWDLDEAPSFHALSVPTIPGNSKGGKAQEQSAKAPGTDKSTTTTPAGSFGKAQQTDHSPTGSLKFDADFEIASEDTASEEYRISKDREFWMTRPSAENAGGIPDKTSGIFGRIYNSLNWKKNKSGGEEKGNEAESLKKKKKTESDDEYFTSAEEEYVHVPARN